MEGHVFGHQWKERSQQEFVYGDERNAWVRALFRALANGQYTNCRIHFPWDGDLRITISRADVEQLYKDITAKILGEDVATYPPVSLHLQQQTVRQSLGLIRVPERHEPYDPGYPAIDQQEPMP